MSRSSVEARPANRAAGNLILIILALLLTALSAIVRPGVEAGDRPSNSPEVRATHPAMTTQPELAIERRGLFVSEPAPHQTRRYHPGMETSNAAGALGFWILLSLCTAMLAAAGAPRLFHRLARMD